MKSMLKTVKTKCDRHGVTDAVLFDWMQEAPIMCRKCIKKYQEQRK